MRFQEAFNKSTVTAAACVILIAFCIYRLIGGGAEAVIATRSWKVEVKRVISGNRIKIEPEGSVLLAGIRAPYRSEPLGDEAYQLTTEIVAGEEMRLRFGDEQKEEDGRLVAFAFVHGAMVNERLVREGLAFVRLRAGEERFADQLLDAQAEARRKRRGLWAHRNVATEPSYIADRKHGLFHRPSCDDVPNIKPGMDVKVARAIEAFDRGFAPCGRCNP